jgi:hypothetical protein
MSVTSFFEFLESCRTNCRQFNNKKGSLVRNHEPSMDDQNRFSVTTAHGGKL